MSKLLPLALLLLLADASTARDLIHPFPPGGPPEVIGASRASRVLRAMQRYAAPAFTDLLAMHVAETLQRSGEPVTVIRRHRGNGLQAATVVASAAADGRTLLFAAAAPDTLTPVAMVAAMPYAWATHGDATMRTLDDLLHAGTMRLLIAHPGERTVAYAPLARLRAVPGSAVEPLAYNGGMAALNALVSRQAVAALVPLPAVLPYAGSGRIRLLAIADAQRDAAVPYVPTTAEAGLRDAEAVVRYAVSAPAQTPAAVLRPLAQALSHVADDAAARELFSGLGVRLEYRGAR